MTTIATRRALDDHRRSRKHLGADQAGPAWSILGSDVLLAALRLADAAPTDMLGRMSRTRKHPELGSRSPLFARLLRPLPSCTYLRIVRGIAEIRCDGDILYTEEHCRPMLVVHRTSLPEQVVTSVNSLRLSQIVDVSGMPALAEVDPLIKRIRNRVHAPTGKDVRVEIDLRMGWHALGSN